MYQEHHFYRKLDPLRGLSDRHVNRKYSGVQLPKPSIKDDALMRLGRLHFAEGYLRRQHPPSGHYPNQRAIPTNSSHHRIGKLVVPLAGLTNMARSVPASSRLFLYDIYDHRQIADRSHSD